MSQRLLNIKCPECGSNTLYLAIWEQIWKILKPRSWHFCSQCGYEKEVGQLKKEMCMQ